MSFFDDLGAAVGNAFCVWLGGVGAAERWLQRRAGLPPGGVGAGIRGALCNDPTPPPPTPPPFEGGQCPGQRYRVSFFAETTNSGRTDLTDPGVYRGPITPAKGPSGSESVIDVGWEYTTAGGSREYRRIIQINEQFFVGAGVTSVVNLDDPADTCGDPEPEIPEFEPPNLPITVPNPDGGPDIDLDLTIFAPIIIGPNVFAPITINGPDINLNGTINLNPEFRIEIGSGLGGGGGSGTEVETDPGDGFDPESPDEPPQADGRRIIGLIVSLSADLSVRATELEQDGDIGSIYVPRAAIAYLISNNGGVRIPLSGVDLKLRRTYVPVPPDVEVVSWRIHTEPGVTVVSVRPVYGSTRPVD